MDPDQPHRREWFTGPDHMQFMYPPIDRRIPNDVDAAKVNTAIQLDVERIMRQKSVGLSKTQSEAFEFFREVMSDLLAICVSTPHLPKWIAQTTGGDITVPALLQVAGFRKGWPLRRSFADRIEIEHYKKLYRWLKRMGIPPATWLTTGNLIKTGGFDLGGPLTWAEILKVDRQKFTQDELEFLYPDEFCRKHDYTQRELYEPGSQDLDHTTSFAERHGFGGDGHYEGRERVRLDTQYLFPGGLLAYMRAL
ncbi:hypothetical protein TWF730_009389 [Orbilia blumenaviensis]|uniref:Uncharacterized protein n=1 Tax=Orbilia blumenaviensis TaxID=1796055 RepID=A0AAV9V182_9PEZI